jgi:repressor LexA
LTSLAELPERQRQIVDFIQEAVKRQGYPPTVREIGLAVGLSSSASVQSHLTSLEAKGFIKRGSLKRRALEVVHSPTQPLSDSSGSSRSVPLVGRVAAGSPTLAFESGDDVIALPEYLGEPDGCFALTVSGTSMIKAGILDGDVVVVKQQRTAEDGDIVVAMIEDEATLKRFYREADKVRLQPENDSMRPIYTRDPQILGRVTGVIRKL